ncbi:hypothetical protein PR048_014540 [Dryococelus australis]|uniref:Tesmin/TSO1-like CXC domain-containing protein n=1 Tax=Dryococelus australis TaxID=614101 RepID=A0ABQ9HER2_9NEOP|nr:hypothetical protein PR048_014540 [Dryococelus australis]
MNHIIGDNISDVEIKCMNKVKPLAIMSRALKVREDIIPVNPQQLFIMNWLQKPPALFDETSMRKTARPSLAMVLKSCDVTSENISADCKLLHALVWPRPATFDQMCEVYATFVQKHFSLTATVVFDGYDKCTTKGEERRRQSAGRSSTDISIAANNVMSMQVDFLRNYYLKNGLIKLLVTYFRASGHHAIQCSGDADITIEDIALQYDTSCDTLAMLTARADEDTHIEVLRSTSGKTTGNMFSTSAIQQDIGEMKNYILLCYAMTGSDTTSAFFEKGNKQAWNIVKSDVSIRSTVGFLMRPKADKRDIISAGEKFAMPLYQDHDDYATLDELRVHMYTRKIVKLPVSPSFQLVSLPPTSAACDQHSLRVYLQVQDSLSLSLDPVVWGCKSVTGTLVPITTSLPPAPEQLLNLISCNCKSDCSYRCECVRAGLQCGIVCAKCREATCTNNVVINDGSDGEDF